MAEEIEGALAVFCVATYGEGDPTDNAQDFWDSLKGVRDGDGPDLGKLNFAVFGLGNRTYELFNEVGRYMDKSLSTLGANRLCNAGEGDDNEDIEEDFSKWCETLWAATCAEYNIDPESIAVDSNRQYELTMVEDIPRRVFVGEPAVPGSFASQRRPYTPKNPFLAKVAVKKELFKDTDRSCLHIELDITGANVRYTAGDHVAIFPSNNAALVDKLGVLLDIDLDQLINMTALDEDVKKKHPFPCPCSFRTALTHYIDITSLPKPHVLRAIAEESVDAKAKDFLLGITSKARKHDYAKWIQQDHRTIVQVLEDLPEARPSVSLLLELLPRLQPRYYSISSSSKRHPQCIHVTVAVVHFTTPLGIEMGGVCTSWLASLEAGLSTVPIFVRSSGFRLPLKQSTPVVMVGPGTGIAPFRGFLQERSYHAQEKGVTLGETLLLFGCQHKAKHFLYEEELEEFTREGTISDLQLAFSRDGPEKVYVQRRLREVGATVFKLLKEQRGHLYVCGDAKFMARDVSKTITELAVEHGGMTEQQAVNWAKDLRKRKRYCEDIWS
jgi:NADPH-ferrihemoprotein reductase